jgi:hypothetical protein
MALAPPEGVGGSVPGCSAAPVRCLTPGRSHLNFGPAVVPVWPGAGGPVGPWHGGRRTGETTMAKVARSCEPACRVRHSRACRRAPPGASPREATEHKFALDQKRKGAEQQMRSGLPRKGTAGLHANDLRHRAGLVCRTATALRLPVGSIKRRQSGSRSASFRSSA